MTERVLTEEELEELDEDYVPKKEEILAAYEKEDAELLKQALADVGESAEESAHEEAMARREIEMAVHADHVNDVWDRLQVGERAAFGQETVGRRTVGELEKQYLKGVVAGRGMLWRGVAGRKRRRKGLRKRDESILRILAQRQDPFGAKTSKVRKILDRKDVSGREGGILGEKALEAARLALSGDLGTVTIRESVRFGGETVVLERVVRAGSAEAVRFAAEEKRREERQARRETMRESQRVKSQSSSGLVSAASDARMATAEAAGSSAGLGAALAVLSGDTVRASSTLEKSSADWDKYKRETGIADTVETDARRENYVDRQAFLARAAQSEEEQRKAIEKATRSRAAAIERQQDAKQRPSRAK